MVTVKVSTSYAGLHKSCNKSSKKPPKTVSQNEEPIPGGDKSCMYLLTQGQLKNNNVVRIACLCRKFCTTIWKTIYGLWKLLALDISQVLVLTCITFVTFRTLLLPHILWKHTHCPSVYLMGERNGDLNSHACNSKLTCFRSFPS